MLAQQTLREVFARNQRPPTPGPFFSNSALFEPPVQKTVRSGEYFNPIARNVSPIGGVSTDSVGRYIPGIGPGLQGWSRRPGSVVEFVGKYNPPNNVPFSISNIWSSEKSRRELPDGRPAFVSPFEYTSYKINSPDLSPMDQARRGFPLRWN